MKALSRIPFAAALGAALLVVPTSAEAAGHANNFGDKGQLILSADRLLPVFNFTYGSVTRNQNGLDITTSRSGSGISFFYGRSLASSELGGDVANGVEIPVNVHTVPRISVDYTIIQHLTLGAGIALAFGLGGTDKTDVPNGNVKTTQESDAPSATVVGFAPRVGYIIPFGDILAFWPRGGLGIYSVNARVNLRDNNAPNQIRTVSATDTIFSLDLDPMLAIVPLEHLFFLVGPMINIPITGSRSVKNTTGATTLTVSNDLSLFNFGIEASLGVWFNLL